MEVRVGVSPGLIESLDRFLVVFHAHGDNEGLILDGSAVPENNFVGIGVEFLDSNVVRVGVVLPHKGSGGAAELELGDAE